MNIFTIGLILIVLGWLVQLIRTAAQKSRALSSPFLLLYAIGCILLFIGNYRANDVITGVLNTICAVIAIILLITVIARKE